MNNVRLDGLKPRNEIFAIAPTAQRRVIDLALFSKEFLFNCLQQAVSCFQAGFRILLLLSNRRIHPENIL
jgi:hypothetical protein